MPVYQWVGKNKENNGKDNFYNVLLIPGTFQWHKNQDKKRDSNFFGKSLREKKGAKVPGPSQYKINTNWSKKENIMKTTSTALYKSVYYH